MAWYWEVLINFSVLLLTLIIFFSRKFTEQFALRLSEIVTAESLTKKIEGVKSEFKQDLEKFKHDLSKEYNVHYFQTWEYQKRRFESLEKLHAKLIELQYYIKNNLSYYEDEEDFNKKKSEFQNHYQEVRKEFQRACLYLDEDINDLIRKILDECYNAFMQFKKIFRTDPDKFNDLLMLSNPELTKKRREIGDQNLEAMITFNKIVQEKFPEMINQVEKTVKNKVILQE